MRWENDDAAFFVKILSAARFLKNRDENILIYSTRTIFRTSDKNLRTSLTYYGNAE
jgi:hypothetical protein